MSGIELFARTSVYDFNLSDRYALPYLARDSSIPVSTSLLFSKLLMVITPSGDSHTRTVGVSIRLVHSLSGVGSSPHVLLFHTSRAAFIPSHAAVPPLTSRFFTRREDRTAARKGTNTARSGTRGMFSLLCHLASALVGAVIPVFYSYKTIKKPSQKMLSYWSKYWAVFGSFLAVDAVLDSLFIHYFIPFYEFGKLLFLIWAVNPYTSGAQFVFDKMLAPFIKRHEKKMDIYVDCMIDNVVTHGPELAITAGTTLWNVARNLHALSRIRTDTLGRALLHGGERIAIADISEDHEEVQEVGNQVVEPTPKIVEVKIEQPESDDEVIFVDPHQHMEGNVTSKSSASSKTPMPTKRRRGRRPTSNVTRRKINRNTMCSDLGEDAFEGQEPIGGDPVKRPMRRSNRVAAVAAKQQLVIVGDDMTGEE
ncbi:hypothetical protein Y032_0240g3339 [Ancylostoma ceylanicum]|uniref:Receptor expression-enhancing protein n=1 Tax=Ancylostoma ceylanicum TaxID=53326 RepID=A0A016SEX4_9BILA|nr:hypothetical protein Y032_0240g3339 [Ancylostoma ceylanicum]